LFNLKESSLKWMSTERQIKYHMKKINDAMMLKAPCVDFNHYIYDVFSNILTYFGYDALNGRTRS
jgi:hypothetical protein